jgi:uncharacterized repeat protein (TIGR03803 family)
MLARVSVLVAASLATPSAPAQTLTVLYAFTGGADGGYPLAGLVRTKAGSLYGTTEIGGNMTCFVLGCGTVFAVDATGSETVLYSFAGPPSDGEFPEARLVVDKAGNFYGTTNSGGANNAGTVFKVSQSGKETVLYSFNFNGKDGFAPVAGLIRDAAGNLYGTTAEGGSYGNGTVFKVDSSGNETVLYSFAGYPADGAYPGAGLTADARGNLYGTTLGGGGSGLGTVFKLDPQDNETVLHSFTSGTDGAYPASGLLPDAAGNLYGTAAQGGKGSCPGGCGVVFEVSKAGKEKVLYRFASQSDGQWPVGGLAMDAAGNLYGTTFGSGDYYGDLFKLDKRGHETVLHNFSEPTDGAYPYGDLVRDPTGNLYGTTSYGGPNYYGTVFEVTPGKR